MSARRLHLIGALIVLPLLWSPNVAASQAAPQAGAGCDVTEPNGLVPPESPYTDPESWYGSGADNPSLWLYVVPDAPIEPPPFFEPEDEGGYGIKTPFWRGNSGPITLTGARLDAPSTLKPHVDAAWDSYPAPGMIATSIWYPSDGCWELTATDGNDTITWTALAVSPFANCRVTSGTDDHGTLPDGATESVITGGPGTPTTVVPADPDHFYGDDGLYVLLGDPDRAVWEYSIDSEWVSADGAITDPKQMWYRQGNAEGKLSITVENSSVWFPGDPVIDVPEGYGASGLQIVGITFPGPGCWEITGTSGNASISFTIRLEIVPAAE